MPLVLDLRATTADSIFSRRLPALLLLGACAMLPGSAARVAAEKLEPRPTMDVALAPFVANYCVDCHSGAEAEAGLALDKLLEAPSVPHKRREWTRVVERLTKGDMPPEDFGQPEPAEKAAVLRWLGAELADPDCSLPQDPGRVTVRRLNRTEYQNTVRDLTGVEFDAAAILPRDELGYGFDNNGDVLSMPPVLLEKYLQAAEEISQQAILAPEGVLDPQEEFSWGELHGGEPAKGIRALTTNGRVWAEVNITERAHYVVRVRAFATQAGDEPTKMRVFVGGDELRTFDVEATPEDPQTYVARFFSETGLFLVGAELINDTWEPWAKDPARRDRNLYIQSITIVGPAHALRKNRQRESQAKLLSWEPDWGDWARGEDKVREPLREQIGRLLIRAFRRPPSGEEIDRFAELAEQARRRGDSYERAMQLVLQATLASPQFLFRGEGLDPKGDGTAPLDDFQLATRLSYFLWSSMPDEELMKVAAEGKLRAKLDEQVERMLQSERADQLIRNFGEQWLETRRLETLEKNADRFPEFSPSLREAMREETFRLLEDVVRHDRPLTTLLSANYSFVNAELAKHYGVELPKAAEPVGEEAKSEAEDEASDKGDENESEQDEFVRVELPAERQAGLLTHGSVLAVTAFPERTSPVLRGKWVLDHLMGDPPPPPPPSAGSLPEATGEHAHKPLRERLALHRDNPSCSACHNRMDPLGFAMENFDAIGRWREKDGEDAIDASGELPDGRKLIGTTGLRDVLLADFSRVRRTIAERLLIYSLGRGLEPSDECTVKEIVAAAETSGDTFSGMVRAIAKSAPFSESNRE